MLMRHSIALENLSRTIPPIDEDQNVALLHVPFKGTTLYGDELAKLHKANMEHASALTVFPAPAAPSPTYAPSGNSFKKGGFSQIRGGQGRNHDRSPSTTITSRPRPVTVRPP